MVVFAQMSKKASILQLNGGVQYPILGIEKNIPQDNRTQDRSKAHENNTRTVGSQYAKG